MLSPLHPLKGDTTSVTSKVKLEMTKLLQSRTRHKNTTLAAKMMARFVSFKYFHFYSHSPYKLYWICMARFW